MISERHLISPKIAKDVYGCTTGPGRGKSGAVYADLEVVIKRDTDAHVAAEYIACHIGQALGVPVVPGHVAWEGNVPYWASVRMPIRKSSSDPFKDRLHAARPDDYWAMEVFDVFIHNKDRHGWNWSWSGADSDPLFLFDHDISTCVDFYDEVRAVRSPWVFPALFRAPHARKWGNRVCDLPDYVIEDAVAAVHRMGLITRRCALITLETLACEKAKFQECVPV